MVDTYYAGIREIELNDEQLAEFYEGRSDITGEINDYLVIINNNTEIGPYKFNGESWEEVLYPTFNSQQFGCIKPKDAYQKAYMDSMIHNQLTFCTGSGGTGKSLLAMAYAFQELEKGRVDRIVVFTNPIVATGAAKLGFLPGTKDDKLLDTSIGNILASKLGDRILLEEMMAQGRIIIMPMGDCRGFEVPEKSFVYFTEAQNTSPYLMKLFLQRTNDFCKIVVEGDMRQTDSEFFDEQNGLRAAIRVFKGEDYAARINLKTIYRGKIAKKAEEII